jgi:hypothetical protein
MYFVSKSVLAVLNTTVTHGLDDAADDRLEDGASIQGVFVVGLGFGDVDDGFFVQAAHDQRVF